MPHAMTEDHPHEEGEAQCCAPRRATAPPSASRQARPASEPRRRNATTSGPKQGRDVPVAARAPLATKKF
jgi:hypothetical protein